MEISLDRFYQLNRKAIIWMILFGLIYLSRDYFTLIFLTFIISFFAFPASKYLNQRLRLNLGIAVTLVYAGILFSYITLYILLLPNVVKQAGGIRTKLPSIQSKLNEMRGQFSENYPNAAWLFSLDIALSDSLQLSDCL